MIAVINEGLFGAFLEPVGAMAGVLFLFAMLRKLEP